MFSNTVMREKIEVTWKLRERPRRLISCGARPSIAPAVQLDRARARPGSAR